MKQTTSHTYQTTCSYCGVGCGITISKSPKGKLSLKGNELYPVNHGMLCSKGMNLHHVVQDYSDRLLYPEVRWAKNMPRVRTSWDEAMLRTSSVVKTMIDQYGPDSIGFYVSGQCLTEEYYLVNKLAKGYIGTNNIDTNSRLCMSSAVVGYKMALGEDAVPISYDDIELADCFFITGANPAWCHPILFRRLEAHKEANPHIKIIVADPRKTQSCSVADIHLQLKPGTDVALNNAIAKCLAEEGYLDLDFLEEHTNGYKEVLEFLKSFTIESAAKECGVSVEDIKLAAQYIGKAKGFISMWAMGLNQSVVGVDKNLSLLNISLLTGQIGKPGSGPFSLTGQPNAMGGREVGGMSNLLPAHRDLNNPEHRKEVADFWGVPSLPEKPGYTATEMFQAVLDDKVKVIWIICTNPLVSLPNSNVVEEALKKARLVVVQDISRNSITADYADVILPAAGWLEKEGTMTNSDRRISYLSKVLDAPGEAIPDTSILKRFASYMGYEGFNFKDDAAVFDEHKALTKGTNIDISGLSYQKLKSEGSAQWPYKEGAQKGDERLFADKQFFTPDKKARLFVAKESNLSEPVSDEFPLVLTTGRVRDHWHTMTKTGKVSKLKQHINNAFLEIHPDDAAARNLNQGDIALIASKYGTIKIPVSITDTIRKGVVFAPMHWGKILNKDIARANNVTSNLIDSRSKEPDFKFTAVDVIKYKKEKERIIIIGAGAGACKFIEEYRNLDTEDEILVFSKEANPFYNRILLPEYYTGHKSWDNLVRLEDSLFEKYKIKVSTNNPIVSIQANDKTVTDSKGISHSYDKLIISTGSRPNLPSGVSVDYNGTFSIRSKEDADRMKKYMTFKKSVVVVGGGLLGLEIASSLMEAGLKVTIVHRNARLMDKQLDKLSSSLLAEIVNEKNIDLMLNDEIASIQTSENSGLRKHKVIFQSGRSLQTDAIVYAIGTRPNIELAVEAGLETKRGVVVSGRMETSAESIYAIGEIAEFNGQLYGITIAAEQQACIAAAAIYGDFTKIYDGTVGMNILKFPGVELCSIGLSQSPDPKEYEEVLFIDKTQQYYKKCIIHKDRLVGAILMGDKTEFNEFKELIENRIELSDKRLSLLRSGQTPKAVKGKLVCSCNNVGEGNILEEINTGIVDFESLCMATGAGTGCGSCKPEVKAILESVKVEETT
nr:molybdopterin-dependent oxidoreductase [uncultured Carboxylicivirga sp.]